MALLLTVSSVVVSIAVVVNASVVIVVVVVVVVACVGIGSIGCTACVGRSSATAAFRKWC